MENPQPTTEPQPIANLLLPALKQLTSRPTSFDSQEEAEAAWRAAKLRDECPGRLIAAGYPARAVSALNSMHGPGLACAEGLVGLFVKVNIEGGMVFLIGDRGPGKTQIATWLAAQRILAGMTCGRYRKALDLWAEIKATWRTGSDKNEDEVLRGFKRAKFLVIDEAQERGNTDADRQWCDRMLTHIVDHRYDAMLPTLFVANLDVSGYESTIPGSVRSRVKECGGVKLCDWPSYR